jgi:hypothetical protein
MKHRFGRNLDQFLTNGILVTPVVMQAFSPSSGGGRRKVAKS